MNINKQHLTTTLYCLALTLIFFGMGLLFNYLVMDANNGKMPVLTNNPLEIKFLDTHFNYEYSDNINLSVLADNHRIGRHYYSLGDLYIYSAIIIFIIYLIFPLIDYLTLKE